MKLRAYFYSQPNLLILHFKYNSNNTFWYGLQMHEFHILKNYP